MAVGANTPRPVHNERRLDATVIKRRFVARERPAVVADKQDECVVGDVLFFQLGHHAANETVEPCDLVVVQRVVATGPRRIGDIRRQANIPWLVWLLEDALVVVAVRIERGEPQEKRLVCWPRLQQRHPLIAAAALIADCLLHNLSSLGRLAGGQLKAGHVGLADLVKAILNCVAQMPLAGRRSPVAGGLEQLDERQPVGRQRPVKLLGIGLVRVGAGDDAGPAGAARADRQVGVCEAHATLGQAVEVRRANAGVAGAAEVVPCEVVGDDENNVGSHIRLAKCWRGKGGECDKN